MLNGLLAFILFAGVVGYIAGVSVIGAKIQDATDTIVWPWLWIMIMLFGLPISIAVGIAT